MKKILSIRIDEDTMTRLKKSYETAMKDLKPYRISFANYVNIVIEKGIYKKEKEKK